ncbi:hypothetical protein HDR58_10485 [bacterium]|nr:hypothetical protein [bacterium]
MAVLPVSSISVRNNGIAFQGKKENKKELRQENVANKMVTVPVAVLMALATTSLNAKEPTARDYDRNIDQTELMAYVSASEGRPVSQSSIITSPKTNILDEKFIYKQMNFNSGGKQYTMYFSDMKSSTKIRKNVISSIYVIPKDHKAVRNEDSEIEYNRPPLFKKLIVHMDGNPDKAFGGALVEEITCDSQGKNRKIIQKEIKLPDDVTNYLLDLLAGDTEYKLLNSLQNVYEKVSNMNIQQPKVIESFKD